MKSQFTSYISNRQRSHDEQYMRLALDAAEFAKSRGDAARGAVLAFPRSYIVESQSVLHDHNPLAHAEMNVFRKSCEMTTKSFKDAILYCTIEPCAMCAIAAYEHGISEIVFGAIDDAHGFVSSGRSIISENFNLHFLGGVLSEECYNMATPTLREHLRYVSH